MSSVVKKFERHFFTRREYPGPREMTDRPLMRRAPRAGEPGPRRRKLIEERKRALSDSYKRAREAKE